MFRFYAPRPGCSRAEQANLPIVVSHICHPTMFSLEKTTTKMISFGAAALLALVPLAVAQNDTTTPYSVKTPPLDTPWTYEVGINPWPEYPRPQLQRSRWRSLNGLWTYRSALSLDEVDAPPFGEPLTDEVLVPSCLESGLSGRRSLPQLAFSLLRL